MFSETNKLVQRGKRHRAQKKELVKIGENKCQSSSANNIKGGEATHIFGENADILAKSITLYYICIIIYNHTPFLSLVILIFCEKEYYSFAEGKGYGRIIRRVIDRWSEHLWPLPWLTCVPSCYFADLVSGSLLASRIGCMCEISLFLLKAQKLLGIRQKIVNGDIPGREKVIWVVFGILLKQFLGNSCNTHIQKVPRRKKPSVFGACILHENWVFLELHKLVEMFRIRSCKTFGNFLNVASKDVKDGKDFLYLLKVFVA